MRSVLLTISFCVAVSSLTSCGCDRRETQGTSDQMTRTLGDYQTYSLRACAGTQSTVEPGAAFLIGGRGTHLYKDRAPDDREVAEQLVVEVLTRRSSQSPPLSLPRPIPPTNAGPTGGSTPRTR